MKKRLKTTTLLGTTLRFTAGVLTSLLIIEGVARLVDPATAVSNRVNISELPNPDGFKQSVSNGNNIYLLSDSYHKLEIPSNVRVIPHITPMEIAQANEIIYVIGDSVTWGFGLPFEKTYFGFLQRNIQHLTKNTNHKISIAAGGWPGDNAHDFQLETLNPKVKTVIYQFNYNDVYPASVSPEAERAMHGFGASASATDVIKKVAEIRYKYLMRSTAFKLIDRYVAKLSKRPYLDCESRGAFAMQQYTFSYGHPGFAAQHYESWFEFEDRIGLVHNALKESNIRFYILISPISLQLRNQGITNWKNSIDTSCALADPYKKVSQIAEKHSDGVIDPLGRFKDVDEKSGHENNPFLLFLNNDTNHPNSFGHQLIGEEVLLFLSRRQGAE